MSNVRGPAALVLAVALVCACPTLATADARKGGHFVGGVGPHHRGGHEVGGHKAYHPLRALLRHL